MKKNAPADTAGAPYTVTLGHHPNFDISGSNGYWQDPIDPALPFAQPAGSLADAARICRDFIARNGLGGGNWGAPFGDVYAASGSETGRVARISYNGRIWDDDGTEIIAEVK
jgi:hypothetical protein